MYWIAGRFCSELEFAYGSEMPSNAIESMKVSFIEKMRMAEFSCGMPVDIAMKSEIFQQICFEEALSKAAESFLNLCLNCSRRVQAAAGIIFDYRWISYAEIPTKLSKRAKN